MRKIIYSIIAFLMIFSSGCIRYNKIQQAVDTPAKIIEKEQYLKIMTTNKLLYYMVKDIVKDRHLVDYMLKTEEEQWNFKYTENSLNNIGKKDIFIYSGASYEPWINGFLEGLKKSKVGITNVSRGIRLLTLTDPRVYVDEYKKETEYKDNPYYWLNPDDYKVALSNIKNSILEKDPKNRDFYEANFSEAIKNVDKYSKDMKLLVDDLKKFTFLTTDDNFDYLMRFLNIKAVKLDKSDLEASNKEKLEKKLGDTTNLVLIYDNEEDIQQYEKIIAKYNIKTIKMMTYKFDVNINDIFKYNYDSINSIISIQ